MANYYASARTNYFNVKDGDAFVEVFNNIDGVEVIREHSSDDSGKYGLLSTGEAGFPSWIYDEESGGDETEIDIMQMVSEHLIDADEIAIFMEAGAEKLRYIIGSAFAINGEGDGRFLDLNGIYDLAKELTDRPDDITRAEY